MLPSSLLVKPVSYRCNLACKYCFYARRSELYSGGRPVMSEKVLEEMISQYMEISTGAASLSWQGGEPLLAGLDFYKRAVALEERYGRGHIVSNAFQTNGTLLDEEWAAFFRRYRFLVGISLDGPRKLHNTYRVTQAGKPSFESVMRGIGLLKRKGVDFNILTVVSHANVSHAEEIYRFFSEEGFRYLQFVPCLERDPVTGRWSPYNVTAEEYGNFLCKLFDLWAEDYPNVYVRFFNSVLAARLGRAGGLCTLGPRCGEYVVVERNGDVYPCDFFVEKEMLLGNLLNTPLRRLVESTELDRFSRAKSRLPDDCRNCPWLDLCFGGCQYHRPLPREHQKSYYCKAYRMFFEHSEEGFRDIEMRL